MSTFEKIAEWLFQTFCNDNFYDAQLRKYLDEQDPKDTAEVERLIREFYTTVERCI
jgi:hypothetical protein